MAEGLRSAAATMVATPMANVAPRFAGMSGADVLGGSPLKPPQPPQHLDTWMFDPPRVSSWSSTCQFW